MVGRFLAEDCYLVPMKHWYAVPKYTASHNGTPQMLLLIAARASELSVGAKRHSYFSRPLKYHTEDGRVQSGA